MALLFNRKPNVKFRISIEIYSSNLFFSRHLRKIRKISCKAVACSRRKIIYETYVFPYWPVQAMGRWTEKLDDGYQFAHGSPTHDPTVLSWPNRARCPLSWPAITAKIYASSFLPFNLFDRRPSIQLLLSCSSLEQRLVWSVIESLNLYFKTPAR